jgi:hypothetical protein
MTWKPISSDDPVSGVRLDTSSLPNAIRRSSLFARLRCWYYVSALRLLLGELSSLRHRIAWVLEIRAWELRGRRGSIHRWPDRELIDGPQSYKRTYIRHMQQIQARHPFLSIFDLFLLGQTWKAGSEWDGRTYTSQNQDISRSSANPEGGNFMPLPAVPQSSRCDRRESRTNVKGGQRASTNT